MIDILIDDFVKEIKEEFGIKKEVDLDGKVKRFLHRIDTEKFTIYFMYKEVTGEEGYKTLWLSKDVKNRTFYYIDIVNNHGLTEETVKERIQEAKKLLKEVKEVQKCTK